MKVVTSAIMSSLCAAFAASADAAKVSEWQAVAPGVVERVNDDGSISRAGYGKAGAQYRYEQIKARIAELASGKNAMANIEEIREAYASLGTMEVLLESPFFAGSERQLASGKSGTAVTTLGGTPDYIDQVCGVWWANFWAKYTTTASTATITSQTVFPVASIFGPPTPPVSGAWTSTSNSAFLTTPGGTWDTDYQWQLTGGAATITTTKSASRLGYCDGFSRGEVSIACPGGTNDFAFYERTYNGCP